MAPYRPADGRGLFDLGKRGRAIAPVLVLLLMVLDGLPAAGAAHAAPPTVALVGTVASPIVTHLPSPAVSNGASTLCRTSSGCASTPAAPHPAVVPPPRWTDLQSKVTNQVPAHRYLGSMAYDPLDGYVVLFGGYGNGSSAPYGDTWSYSNGRWNEISPSGPRWYAAMMTWDAADNYILLFGGYDSSTGTIYNDTWSFVHGTWNQLNPATEPPARWRGAMAFDIADNYTVLFGGTPDTGTLSPLKDTWTFNAGVWTDQSTKVSGNPAAKFRQEMAYDAADGYAVMFGGCTASGCTGTDTWTYSNLTWKQLSLTVKPTARAYEGITYDAAQGYVLMYAGDDYTTNVAKTDTWEFLGGNWTDLSGQFTTYPSTRAFEMLAYDGADGYSLLFGGQNPSSATFLNDTWAYGPSVIGHFVASPTTIDLSQAVSFNATPFAFAGYANFSYSNLPPGCVGGNFSVITCTPTATGLFDVSVSINDSLGFPTVKDAVVAVNEPLAITGITAMPSTVTAGTRFHVNVTAVNGTLPFAFSYTGLPAGCSSANTASLGCTPTGTGSFTIFGNVVDATGFFTSVHIGVTVNPQPSLSALVAAPSTIDLGEHFTLWANATGGTAPLSYAYSGLPIGCSSVDGPTMMCTPTATGAGTVHVNVTDSFGWSASASLTVTVNPAPSITGFAVSPGTIDLGGKVTFWLNATGGTGALSVQYAGMPVGCNLGRQTTGQCTPTENGSFTITGTATDARGISVVQQVTLVIVTDPSIDSVTPTPTLVDVGQNVTISTVVSGGTSPISYTYTGLPTGCTNTSSSNVVCRPRTSGQFTIVAQITDAWGMTSQLSTLLEVSAAPSISGFTATVSPVTVGSSTTLQVTVTGGTGPFTYVYTNLPAGCTSANKSSLVCAPSAAGTFNVTVKVTDRLGVSATSSTQFEVDAASSSSGILGLSGSTGYLVIALIVIVIVVALAAVMMMRRRRPPAQPAEEWAESPAEETQT